jgi:hypothetical protein
MNSTSAAPSRPLDRRFYTLAGLFAAAIILWGFGKTYYLKLAFGTPALSPLLHVHGLVMSAWVALFILQARLVATGRVALHRTLGLLGAVVALAVLVVGPLTAITAARLGRTPGPPPLVFLVVPMGDMVVFATLVGLGLWFRSRPDIHKRLMLLSCVGILAAAVARIPLALIAAAGPLAYFGITDLFVLTCLALDWKRHGRLHPAFGWGALFIILSHPLRLILGGTSLWLDLAKWMVG